MNCITIIYYSSNLTPVERRIKICLCLEMRMHDERKGTKKTTSSKGNMGQRCSLYQATNEMQAACDQDTDIRAVRLGLQTPDDVHCVFDGWQDMNVRSGE